MRFPKAKLSVPHRTRHQGLKGRGFRGPRNARFWRSGAEPRRRAPHEIVIPSEARRDLANGVRVEESTLPRERRRVMASEGRAAAPAEGP